MGKRISRATQTIAAFVILALLATAALGQPGGPPEWITKIDPAKYVLLAADIKPPFAWGTSPEVQAEGQGVGIKDAQGRVSEQTIFFMYAMQNIKPAQPYANTAATKPPTAMRWDMGWTMTVGIYQSEEVAKAAVRTHYLSLVGPFTAEDENCLNDGRLRNGRGAAGAMGRFVRYRNLLLKIDMSNVQEVKGNRPQMDADLWYQACGNAESHQQDLIAKLAVQWLDKVAGPDRADLRMEPSNVFFRWWEADPRVEREMAADQQYVLAYAKNTSDKVAAVGAQIQLLVAKPGDAEFQPVSRPVRLPDIPPGDERGVVLNWDLDGKNLENVLLRELVAKLRDSAA